MHFGHTVISSFCTSTAKWTPGEFSLTLPLGAMSRTLFICRPRYLTVVTDARVVLLLMTCSAIWPGPRGDMTIRLVSFSLQRSPISSSHSTRRETTSYKSLATTAGLLRKYIAQHNNITCKFVVIHFRRFNHADIHYV